MPRRRPGRAPPQGPAAPPSQASRRLAVEPPSDPPSEPRIEPPFDPPRATLHRLDRDEPQILLERPVLHIGRARDRCGLVLDDPDLAPQHCCLRRHLGRWWLLDRGAPAGTYLNNHRCRQPRELHDGDRISLGLCLLEFRATPAPALPRPVPVALELHLPTDTLPPLPAARPALLRTVILTALAALAVTLPVAANLTPPGTTTPRPVPSDIPITDPTPVPSDSSTATTSTATFTLHPRPVLPDIPPLRATAPAFLSEPPTLELPGDALARGRPDDGHLEHALRLPPSPDYLVRCPAHAHASSSTAHELMQALSAFRNHSGYRGELVVGDLSQAGGGRYGPHRSHQSGRDVDLWLPISGGRYRRGCVRCGTDLCRPAAHEVDWRATWQLVQALAARGSAQDIFLAWELQPRLRRAALALAVPGPELEQAIQHPVRGRPALVKHAPGHTHHLHVRFRCPPGDSGCVRSP